MISPLPHFQLNMDILVAKTYFSDRLNPESLPLLVSISFGCRSLKQIQPQALTQPTQAVQQEACKVPQVLWL